MSSVVDTTYEVVAIGETMLRLTPPGFERLEVCDHLQMHVGGSESNTAVGLSRLGRRVAWVSRLTNNHLGHRIANAIQAHGVDVSHLIWTEQERVGLYFLETGSAPRASHVIYDRANSAYAKFDASMLPTDLFHANRSRWLHVTGISLWLNSTVRSMIERAVALAKAAGWSISFDVNYRELLTSAADARVYCESLFAMADIAFVPRRDAGLLWSLSEGCNDEEAMRRMLDLRSGKPTVMTLGSRGAMAADANRSVMLPVEPVEPIGRLGGGDAFAAGFLDAWLDDKDLASCLKWATATARLKYSIPGDLPLISRSEVERIANGSAQERWVR